MHYLAVLKVGKLLFYALLPLKHEKRELFGVLTWGGIGFGLIFSVNTAQKNPEIRQYIGIFYVLS